MSAGEIGAYTVCPEAWRLREVAKVPGIIAKTVEERRKLHKEWASDYDEAVSLVRGAKLVVFLVVLAAVLYALT